MTSKLSTLSKNSGFHSRNFFQHYFQFNHPTTILIAGPTQAGKTEFVINILKNADTLIREPPNKIIWAYGQKNDRQMDKIAHVSPNVEFIEGFPNLDCIDTSQNTLLILDDLMDEIGKSATCANLFTRGSHHLNITVIAIIHNLFNQQKHSRTISLNARYYVLFKSPRDNQQIRHFGRQIFPSTPSFLPDALNDACKTPFGYVVIDLHPMTPDSLRLHSGIFPNEIPRLYIQ